MSWEKNSKKQPIIANNFCFPVDLIRPTGPMVTMITRYTGGLSQLLLVVMSWEKNSKEKLIIEMLNSSPQSPLPSPPHSPRSSRGVGDMGKNKIC